MCVLRINKQDEVVFFGLLKDLFPGMTPPRKSDEKVNYSYLKCLPLILFSLYLYLYLSMYRSIYLSIYLYIFMYLYLYVSFIDFSFFLMSPINQF